MAKIFALKPNVKRHIFHPLTRARFNDEGVADWPLDGFTVHRIRDGDVSLRPPGEQDEAKRDYGD
jgi:hypothetical protein